MSFQQAFYTSCSTGLRGGKGFQINAATQAIDASTLELVERLGVYVPPVSSPTRPSVEEIETFPLSLVFYRVPDGRIILGQSKYIGIDYSGRFGNYFSHCLVTHESDPAKADFLPVELWRSRTWATKESLSPSLPSVDCPEAGGVIDPTRVCEFLAQRNRIEHFPALLTAVEGALATGKRIVIVDDSESIALWIASVSYALPPHLAWMVTFNTYVKNPYQTDVLIAGTTRDSDFAFSPHEIEHQYCVFDFDTNRFSRLIPSIFAKDATAGYKSGRAEDVARFGAFVERIAPDLRGQELGVAFGCYALSIGMATEGFENAELVKWCSQRVSRLQPEFIRSLAASVGQSTDVSAELITAFGDLHKVAVSGSASSMMREAVERAYVALLIQRNDVLSGDAFGRVVEDLQLSPAARATGQEVRGVWFERVRAARDPTRLCAFFSLGGRLGLLVDNGEVIRRLAETVIGPGLTDPVVQQAVLRQLPTTFAADLISGIGTHLQARASDGAVFHALRSFLIRPEVLKVLEDYAINQSAVELYYRLIGEQCADRPDQRADSFRHCLGVTQRLRAEPTPSRLEFAFEAVWQGATPTIAEAISVLNATSENVLAKTSIPSKFAGVLARGFDLTRIDPQRDELAERLRGATLLSALGEERGVVDAWDIAKRLRSPEFDPGPLINSAIQVAGRLQQGQRESLSDLAARRLIEVQDREKHSDLLLRGNAALGQPFMNAYAKCAQSFLAQRRSPEPGLVSRLFCIWFKVSSSLGDRQSRVLLNDVLRQSVRKWRQSDFQAAQSGLGIDTAVNSAWARWAPRTARSRPAGSGIMGRLLRWFVICLVIVIGLTAGLMLARRFFGSPSEDRVQVSEPAGDSSGSEVPKATQKASPKDKKASSKQPGKRRSENGR
ncbi:MAG: GTPase-associated protein 1-related protein [Ignavibacteriota bacterium]